MVSSPNRLSQAAHMLLHVHERPRPGELLLLLSLNNGTAQGETTKVAENIQRDIRFNYLLCNQ